MSIGIATRGLYCLGTGGGAGVPTVIRELTASLVTTTPLVAHLGNVASEFDIEHCIGEDFIADITVRTGASPTDPVADISGYTLLFTPVDNRKGTTLYATRTGAGAFEVLGSGDTSPNARLTITDDLTSSGVQAGDEYDFDMWAVDASGFRTAIAKGKYKLRARQTPEASFP